MFMSSNVFSASCGKLSESVCADRTHWEVFSWKLDYLFGSIALP